MNRDDREEMPLEEALAQAETARRELLAEVFKLRSLIDSTHELARLERPGDMLEPFVLMAMGAVGAQAGVALLADTLLLESEVACRGFAEQDVDRLREAVPRIVFFPENDPLFSESDPQARIVTRNFERSSGVFPEGTRILVRWVLDSGAVGFLGLGDKITGEPYTGADEAFLVNLASSLAAVMDKAMARRIIEDLNQDLTVKNARLKEVAHKAETARREVDRRVHHLKSLYEVTREIGPLDDPDEICASFLLTIMGTCGMHHGAILVYDRADNSVRQVCRKGGTAECTITPEEAGDLIYRCIQGVDFLHLEPLRAQEIDLSALTPDPAPDADSQGSPIPFVPRLGMLVRLDDTTFGLVAAGARHTDDAYGPEERELLQAHVSNLSVFLRKALLFKAVNELNTRVQGVNEELWTAIEELSESRSRIEVLEDAGAAVRDVLRQKHELVRRARPLDFVWTLLIALVLGLVFNMTSPNGISLVPEVLTRERSPVMEARKALGEMADGAVLVDARPSTFYKEQHVRGSVNIPPDLFEFLYAMHLAKADLEKPVLVYGRTVSSLYDEEVAYRLGAQGHEKVYIVQGGMDALVEAGLGLVGSEQR